MAEPFHLLPDRLTRVAQLGKNLLYCHTLEVCRAGRGKPRCRSPAAILHRPIPLHREIVLHPQPDLRCGFRPLRSRKRCAIQRGPCPQHSLGPVWLTDVEVGSGADAGKPDDQHDRPPQADRTNQMRPERERRARLAGRASLRAQTPRETSEKVSALGHACRPEQARFTRPIVWPATRSRGSMGREYHLLCVLLPTLRRSAAIFEDFLA